MRSADEVFADIRRSRQERVPWPVRRRLGDVRGNAIVSAARIAHGGRAAELGVREIRQLSETIEAAVDGLSPQAAAMTHERLRVLADVFAMAIAAEIAELGDW